MLILKAKKVEMLKKSTSMEIKYQQAISQCKEMRKALVDQKEDVLKSKKQEQEALSTIKVFRDLVYFYRVSL